MLAVKLADVGIGAVLGAIITGAVLLLLDQRRRSWESKTRFLAERRESYNTFLRHAAETRDDFMLIAGFKWLLKKTKPEGAKTIIPEGWDLQTGRLAVQLVDRLGANLTRNQEVIESISTDQAVLWPEPAQRAGDTVLVTLVKMGRSLGKPSDLLANLDAFELSGLAALDDEYHHAREGFVAEVRRDLSIRT